MVVPIVPPKIKLRPADTKRVTSADYPALGPIESAERAIENTLRSRGWVKEDGVLKP